VKASPLELLLPAGRANRALVLGSGCPEHLWPAAAPADASEPVDLVVIAPTEAECEAEDWLAHAATSGDERLARDGVTYALVPRRWRSRARKLLARQGLEIEGTILHLPDLAASRQLVPLEPAPAQHAFRSVVPLVPWKRGVAGTLLALRGARLIASRAEGVGLVARRPGGRPLLEWLPLPGVGAAERRTAVISSSWRPGGASVVLHPFAAGAEPAIVAKLSLDPEAEAEHESERSRLARLGPAARRAGARVPEPLDGVDLHGSAVLIETRVEGEILAPKLVRHPGRLGRALTSVCDWLEKWGGLTATRTSITQGQLESEVLVPAGLLAPRLRGGVEYLAALEARCAAAAGTVVPLTAAHNDLTMWNVLVDSGAALGIVDWEAAEESALPLKDFFYAVVDAVAATRGYADRVEAVEECFGAEGSRASSVQGLQASLAGAVGAEPGAVELAFHACWLGHAANELRSSAPTDPTPFGDIVGWLARREASRRG
jgi:hypothetical protein